jgi:hypothetical protein
MRRSPTPSRPLRRRLFIAACAALVGHAAAAAEPPQGKVVLTVSSPAGAGAAVDFDMAMLAALPQHQIRTTTPWHAEPRTYSGPLLRDVLAAAGAKGEQLKAVALNRYKVDIPRADAQRWPVIVARLVDGQPMAIRDKGPLFVIYPFDSDADLRSERYYSRSAWQLRGIEVN